MKINLIHIFSLVVGMTGYTLASSPAEKPNIIVILLDDLGYSDLGAYGGEVRTPNIDKLAGNGLRFTQWDPELYQRLPESRSPELKYKKNEFYATDVFNELYEELEREWLSWAERVKLQPYYQHTPAK